MDYDKHFKGVQRLAFVGIAVYVGLILGALGFLGWVVVKLMAYYGVI